MKKCPFCNQKKLQTHEESIKDVRMGLDHHHHHQQQQQLLITSIVH
jgi:glutaredoxin